MDIGGVCQAAYRSKSRHLSAKFPNPSLRIFVPSHRGACQHRHAQAYSHFSFTPRRAFLFGIARAEVAGEHHWRAGSEHFRGIRCQPLEPLQLVVELRARRRTRRAPTKHDRNDFFRSGTRCGTTTESPAVSAPQSAPPEGGPAKKKRRNVGGEAYQSGTEGAGNNGRMKAAPAPGAT